MKIMKSEYRATISDDHLEQNFRLVASDYFPSYYQQVNYIHFYTITSIK